MWERLKVNLPKRSGLKVFLLASNDLIMEKNLSKEYSAAWVLVNFRCSQVKNQEWPSLRGKGLFPVTLPGNSQLSEEIRAGTQSRSLEAGAKGEGHVGMLSPGLLPQTCPDFFMAPRTSSLGWHHPQWARSSHINY